MKILYITKELGYSSGILKSAIDILHNLMNIDCNVCVLSCNKLNTEKSKYKIKWIKAPKFYRIKDNTAKEYYKWILKKISDLFLLNYKNKIFHYNPDIIILNSFPSVPYYLKVGKFTKAKSVIFVRSSIDFFFQFDYMYSFDEAIHLLKQFDHLVFLSENEKDKWMKYLGKKSFFVIPNCIEEEEVKRITKQSIHDVRDKLHVDPKKYIIACVANIKKKKNQGVFIKYFNEIKKSIPSSEILLIGKVEDVYGRKIKKVVNNDDEMRSFIKFLGRKRNALEYIYISDVVVLPSKEEVLARVILEAMAFGKPVVASNTGGIQSLIQSGENGILYETEKPEQMIEALKDIYRNREEAKLYGENAKNTYLHKFSRINQMEKFKTMIEKVRQNCDIKNC